MKHVALITLVALPPAIVCAWSSSTGSSASDTWIALSLALLVSIGIAWWRASARDKSLRTIASVLSAYREGDFSIRARVAGGGGGINLMDVVLSDVLGELNQLGDVLRSHRLGEMEAWGLLRKVMAEVDVVVLAIDDDGRIRLANDAAARVLGASSRDLLGKNASELGLGDLLEGTVPRIAAAMPGKLGATIGGPWELRRGSFRLSGEQQTLVVLSDVSRALRDNERDAWRRLIRVMGHEINNSLSPIRSISESLLPLLEPTTTKPRPADWETDVKDGLAVIARRAESLSRFMTSYATLARLPPPRRAPIHVPTWIGKIAALEKRASVEVVGGPDVTLAGDADQLEQALINLVKNAAEAGAGVRIRWTLEEDDKVVAVSVEDDGPGVSDTTNLFVPFFTTKPNGSGIGLVLSRQIVEAHEGQLSVVSRTDGTTGAIARMRLPI